MTFFENNIEQLETDLSPATVAFIASGYDLFVTGVLLADSQESVESPGFIRVTPLGLYMRTGEDGVRRLTLESRTFSDEVIHFDAREETGFQVLPIAD